MEGQLERMRAHHKRVEMSRDLNDNITQTFRDLKVNRLGDHDLPVKQWGEADIDALEAELLGMVRDIVKP